MFDLACLSFPASSIATTSTTYSPTVALLIVISISEELILSAETVVYSGAVSPVFTTLYLNADTFSFISILAFNVAVPVLYSVLLSVVVV